MQDNTLFEIMQATFWQLSLRDSKEALIRPLMKQIYFAAQSGMEDRVIENSSALHDHSAHDVFSYLVENSPQFSLAYMSPMPYGAGTRKLALDNRWLMN